MGELRDVLEAKLERIGGTSMDLSCVKLSFQDPEMDDGKLHVFWPVDHPPEAEMIVTITDDYFGIGATKTAIDFTADSHWVYLQYDPDTGVDADHIADLIINEAYAWEAEWHRIKGDFQ